MNVAAHAFILASQRLPAEHRREPKAPTRPELAFKPLRDVQGVAPGRPIAADPKRRDALAERRTPRRALAETPLPFARRDGDERGRLLDVYC